MSNLFLGLLATAGLAGLWIATLCPHPPIARNRSRFVLVATGLVAGLILNSVVLKARLQSDVTPVFAAGLLQTWMYAGPLLAGCLNLALLIHERSRMSEGRTLICRFGARRAAASHPASARPATLRARALLPTARDPSGAEPPAPALSHGSDRASDRVLYSRPYFLNFCLKVARWIPIRCAVTRQSPWLRRRAACSNGGSTRVRNRSYSDGSSAMGRPALLRSSR